MSPQRQQHNYKVAGAGENKHLSQHVVVYSITALGGNRDDINLYTVIISVGHTSSNFQPHHK